MIHLAHIYDAATPIGEGLLRQKNELMNAMDKVQNLYLEHSPKQEFQAALHALIELGREQFSYEEALMKSASDASSTPDLAHLETHAGILKHMTYLQRQVERTNPPCLQPQLRFLRHWMTNHISEEMLTSLYQRQEPHRYYRSTPMALATRRRNSSLR